MLILPQNRPKFLILWLKSAHVIQMLATTFVAGEKGWDGVALVTLVFVTSLLELTCKHERLAEGWLKSSGIKVKASRFGFTRQMPMVGAIQEFSGSKCTGWMDSIVEPHA